MNDVDAAHSFVEAPRSVNDLRRAIALLATQQGTTVARLQTLVANVVLSQMLPDSAVKGGTGLKLRFGDTFTRETPDLDTAFRGDAEEFDAQLATRLANKWSHFGGRVRKGEKRAPKSVPRHYVMQPYEIPLTYRGKSFATVDLEVGWDELEATTNDRVEKVMSPEVLDIFAALGLLRPNPVRVLPLHHQIAQKLHACTQPENDRAHDLVDLQLMVPLVDDALVLATVQRLFDFRQEHNWSEAKVAPGPEWASLYQLAADNLDVVPDVTDAIAWTNAYIDSLRKSSSG